MWSRRFLAPLQLHRYHLGMCTSLDASLKPCRSELTRSKLCLYISVTADKSPTWMCEPFPFLYTHPSILKHLMHIFWVWFLAHLRVVIQKCSFSHLFLIRLYVKPSVLRRYAAFYDFVSSPPLLQFYGFLECLCLSLTCVLLLYLHTHTDLGPHYAGMRSISLDCLRVWILRCWTLAK